MEDLHHDSEAATARRKETEKQRATRLKIAVSEVLASPSGRAVLGEILGYCGVESINGMEGMAAGRIEGARAVGIRVIDLLRGTDLDGWMRLYREIQE